MGLKRLWQRWLGQPGTSLRPAHARRPRLALEQLEDRMVPASFTATNVGELVAHITAANGSAEADTITLAPGKTFTLTHAASGETGLPIIAGGGGALTIVGNGDVIKRSAPDSAAFRLIAVEQDAELKLENLTLQGGLASSGGAIYNAGQLTMIGVTVRNNTAVLGGGISSNGSLHMEDCVIKNNKAVGSDGRNGYKAMDPRADGEIYPPTFGGWGFGGGVFVAGGTVDLFDTTVKGNSAKGGHGGKGKFGLPNASDGSGRGGGLYIAWLDADVSLDACTLAHVIGNTADYDPDISGTYSMS